MLACNYCKEVISGWAGATTISKLVALLPPFFSNPYGGNVF